MSCFALIAAIETDLRDIISLQIEDPNLMPEDIIKIASERFKDHNQKIFIDSNDSLRELLDYIDFYDLSKILNKISNIQDFFLTEELTRVTSGLERLSACRNRVCHSRPLEISDFGDLLDFARELSSQGTRLDWRNINSALRNLDNPSFALSLRIPEYWKNQRRSIYNNLPLPEFDDIGFIGRDKDRHAINSLLASNTKVISIVGEGGIGKTALAQRCLYDILDLCEDTHKDTPMFDIILWVSLKTNRLTVAGVDQIKDAITSGAGLFQDIAGALGSGDSSTIDAALKDIHDYMGEFRILLCIDNLETISGGEIRDFLANIPQGSKILITTRVGLGEIEYRYKLDKMDDKPSITLIRSLSKLLNIESIYKKNNETLKEICKKLFNNPLLMKWYVLSVAAGNNPGDVLRREGDSFKDALKFCFENLYDRLSDIEIKTISVIACWRKPVSAVELRFILSDTDEVAIEETLNQLHNSSMLESTIDRSDSRTYSLTGVASEYINTLRPASQGDYELVKRKRKELQATLDQQQVMQNHYKYDINAIYWANRDEKICAVYLKRALTESKRGNSGSALEYIKRAKSMMPEFSECYRINSLVLKESPFQAQTELAHAVELNPHSSLTRYAYALFLLKEEDYPTAEEQINAAISIDAEDISLKTCKAWIFLLTGRYKLSSDIYEEILPLQANRPKKFRLSTIDQATNCYLRWGEQLLRDSDYNESKKCLTRAGDILASGLSQGDYDDATVIKLCKLLSLSDLYYQRCGDSSLSVASLNTIDLHADYLSTQCLQKLKEELGRYSLSPDAASENKGKAKEIIDRLNGPDQKFGAKISGSVLRVVESERGVSFGFIRGDNELEYFFHRSYLRPNNMLDNGGGRAKVSFSPGRSAKGLCAFDVEKT